MAIGASARGPHLPADNTRVTSVTGELAPEWRHTIEADAVNAWLRLKRRAIGHDVCSYVGAFQKAWEAEWLKNGSLRDLLDRDLSLPTLSSWAVWGADGGTPTDKDLERGSLKPWIMMVGYNWGSSLTYLPSLLDAGDWSNFHQDPRSYRTSPAPATDERSLWSKFPEDPRYYLRVPPHTKLQTLADSVTSIKGAYLTDAFKLLPSATQRT